MVSWWLTSQVCALPERLVGSPFFFSFHVPDPAFPPPPLFFLLLLFFSSSSSSSFFLLLAVCSDRIWELSCVPVGSGAVNFLEAPGAFDQAHLKAPTSFYCPNNACERPSLLFHAQCARCMRAFVLLPNSLASLHCLPFPDNNNENHTKRNEKLFASFNKACAPKISLCSFFKRLRPVVLR